GLYLHYGDGRAAFASPLHYLATGFPVGTGDYQRDGRPDLFLFHLGRALTIVTSEAQGFNAPRGFSYAAAGSAQNLAAGDVNGDGIGDIVVVGGSLTWVPGTGRGTFGAPITIDVPNNGGTAAAVLRDFNRDGRLDLALLQSNSLIVTILLNNGRGQFTPRSTFNVNGSATQLGVADFNQDGSLDLVTRGQAGGLALYLGNGQGNFTPNATGLGGSEAGSLFAIGDFNGDGLFDLAYPDPLAQSGQSAARLFILPGNGQGGFNAAIPVNGETSVSQIIAGDLNLDGHDDLIYSVFSSPYAVNVALSNGKGGFDAFAKYPTETTFPFHLQLADLNGDGKLDLLGNASNHQSLLIWMGKGDGSFNAPLTIPASGAFATILTADADEDGDLDVIAASTIASALAVITNRNGCSPAGGAVTASAASYAPHRNAGDSINALFGVSLSSATQAAAVVPLPTTLSNVSLRMRDSAGVERLAPLFFVSPGQINYLTPAGLAPGVLTFTVLNGGNAVATGTTWLVQTAPGLFSVDATGAGLAAAVVLRVRANGAQVYESIARLEQGGVVPIPIDVSNTAEQVFLILFGTGLRNRNANGTVTFTANGAPLEVLYAGTQAGFAGLDQLNLRLPATLAGRGQIELQFLVDGRAANPVNVTIK
ncbi:MAG: hypothetical protein HOP19_29355, partial [Acidobacteria bacterium]|nr:hypothetical protein [Acidobacteriota bacterium]